MIKRKRLHAVKLHTVRQQPLLAALQRFHLAVQLLRRVPSAPKRPIIFFCHKLLRAGNLAVNSAAVFYSALCIYSVNDFLSDCHIGVENFCTCLKLTRIGYDKIARRKVGNIFVHVKAAGERDRCREKHHRQR